MFLQLNRPGARLEIRADSISEYSERQEALATGSVRMAFYDASGQAGVDLRADRMHLDHRTGTIAMAGHVLMHMGDSLSARTDSLRWHPEGERVAIPGTLRIEMADGVETGRDLETDSSADSWALSDVHGRWQWADEEVDVRAERERSQRVGGALQVRYEKAELQVAGMQLRCALAHWLPDERQLVLGGGVEGVDSSGAFSARHVEVDIDQKELRARGQVRVQRGQAQLEAEEWREAWREHRSQIAGHPARYRRAGRRMEALRMDYERDDERVEASGAVLFSEGERMMRAQTMVYDSRRDVLRAGGGVSVKGEAWEGVLSGDSLFFDLRAERGWLLGTPRLHSREENDLRWEADSMHFDMAARALMGDGQCALSSGDVRIRAQRSRYAADAQRFTFGEGVVLERRTDGAFNQYRIEADSMVVLLDDGVAQRAEIGGALSGKIAIDGQRTSWLSGSGGAFTLRDDRLQQVDLASDADVTYRHAGRDEVSRFRGDSMVLYFDEGGLYQVRVEGDARLASRLVRAGSEATVNSVKGSEMDLYFVDGSLAKVKVGPDIEGHYLPAEDGP